MSKVNQPPRFDGAINSNNIAEVQISAIESEIGLRLSQACYKFNSYSRVLVDGIVFTTAKNCEGLKKITLWFN